MILAPSKQFLVENFLNNPNDPGTYFCRATIINSITGATISTFNLTDNGGLYFSALWNTAADPSGTGLQVTISITTYTDAAYTQIAPAYGTDKKTYIIRDLAGVRLSGAYSGHEGSATKAEKIDYKKIEMLVKAIVSGIPEPVEPKEYDDSLVRATLQKLEVLLRALPKTDEIAKQFLSPIQSKLEPVFGLPQKLTVAHKIATDNIQSHLQAFSASEEAKLAFFKQQLDKIVKGAIAHLETIIEQKLNQPINVHFNGGVPEKTEGSRESEKPKAALNPKPAIESPHMPAIHHLVHGF